jgi:hypothetical protein
MVTQTTQHPARWKAHDKTHQNYIFFFKKKFSKKNSKKNVFFKKKVFFSIFFLKKKFFSKKKILKKIVFRLGSAQEDAKWRGWVFLFRLRGRWRCALPRGRARSARSARALVQRPRWRRLHTRSLWQRSERCIPPVVRARWSAPRFCASAMLSSRASWRKSVTRATDARFVWRAFQRTEAGWQKSSKFLL